MNKTEEEILFSFINQHRISKTKQKVSKARWDKVIKKYFPETFGIELEVPYKNLKIDFENYNKNIFFDELSESEKETWHKVIQNKHNDGYVPIEFGCDGHCMELRTFSTVNSLPLLQKALNVIKDNVIDDNYTNSLHIHQPTPLTSLRTKKTSQNPKFANLYDAYIKNRSLIKERNDCKSIKILHDVIGMKRAGNCNYCPGCGWSRDPENSLRIGGVYNASYSKMAISAIDSMERKVKSSICKKATIELQKHHDPSFKVNVDERGSFINIQSGFRTFEFRRMKINNSLMLSEVLLKVMLTRTIRNYLIGKSNDSELNKVYGLYKNMLVY